MHLTNCRTLEHTAQKSTQQAGTQGRTLLPGDPEPSHQSPPKIAA